MAIPGAPGTLLSLLMRALQFIFATASFVTLMMAPRLLGYSVYWGLGFGMLAVMPWSFGLGCYDVHLLRTGGGRPEGGRLAILLMFDFLIAGLALGTASMAAGVTALFVRDGTHCTTIPIECNRATISVIFAFIAWLFEAISSLVIFWLWCSL